MGINQIKMLAHLQLALINMDWLIANFFLPVLIGIVVTLASPIVRSLIIGIYQRSIIWLGIVTLKSVKNRILQIEFEYKAIVDLRGDHSKTSVLIFGALMPLCLCLALIILPLFYFFATKDEMPQWLFSAIAGIIGVGFRWFLEAVSAFNRVAKAADFIRYEARYKQEFLRLTELRYKLERGLNS